jgi:hypothetical protein
LKKKEIFEHPSTIAASLIRSEISSNAFLNINPEKTDAAKGATKAKMVPGCSFQNKIITTRY